jgi:lipopolysaccharide/colanic/teichoic acid biosynthesis glycosyltransferase
LAHRVANVTLAALALVVVSPLLVFVALLIKLTSRGPIFYMQARVGLDQRRNSAGHTQQSYDRRIRNLGGRAFMIYKFRSMTADAENRSGAVWATQADARVTKLGRILRKTRIDEIPQLINVLKGDMNIVGPRPERPTIFLRLSEQISEYSRRQRARPGITGLAQINQSYDSCLDDVRRKVRYDLEYLERRSLLEDFKIMAMTIPVMVLRRGGW